MFPPVPFLFLSMAMGALALWIWCLIDAIKSEFKEPSQKQSWIFMLALIPAIGVVLYLTIGQKQKKDPFSNEL